MKNIDIDQISDRITSYNVCYTKLLRTTGVLTATYNLSPWLALPCAVGLAVLVASYNFV